MQKKKPERERIKIDTDGRSGKLRFHLLQMKQKGTALYTHSYIPPKQPKQLAAPLEPGEGKRSC